MITSYINFLAHGIKRKEGVSWSEALRIAYRAAKLREQMRNGVVRFTFTKKSTGEKREAIGTIRLDSMPEEKRPKNNRQPKATNTVPFFDTVKGEWRSFAAITLLEVAA